MKNKHMTDLNLNKNIKNDPSSSEMTFFNCENNGHFIVYCPKPKKDDFKKKKHKKITRIQEMTARLWFPRRVKANGKILVRC